MEDAKRFIAGSENWKKKKFKLVVSKLTKNQEAFLHRK
jgi:hypothetical protein